MIHGDKEHVGGRRREALFWVMCYDLAMATKDIQILYVFIFLIVPTGSI